jgi:hypothetical protein
MTDDLVKRLRKRREFESIDGYKRVEWEDEDALEAADEIERLKEEIDLLKNQRLCYTCPCEVRLIQLAEKCDTQAAIIRGLT